MNTDNMSLAGETIDYGPCAFMDTYDPATVFSSIDAQGRYAFGNQPAIAQWNLTRLAEAMLTLFDADQASGDLRGRGGVERFAVRFEHHWLAGMRAKLGLFGEDDGDTALIDALLAWMDDVRRGLHGHVPPCSARQGRLQPRRTATPRSRPGTVEWRARLARQARSADEVTATDAASQPRRHPAQSQGGRGTRRRRGTRRPGPASPAAG